MVPIALLISCRQYGFGERLPYALSSAGFKVITIAHASSLINLSDYAMGKLSYDGVINVMQLTALLCQVHDKFNVDVIVPCDTTAAACLDSMATTTCEHPSFGALKNMLSLWQGGFNRASRTRSVGVEIAHNIGLRTPRQVPLIPNTTTAADLATLGSPVVVKQDHHDGGTGVFIVSTARDALDAAPIMARRAQAVEGGRIVAQEFIGGRPASVSFSAYQGRMLEAFSYVAVEQHPRPTGAASVISVIESPELVEAARRIVDGFGYSGFGGVDFILPSDRSPPVFLELNARPTQTVHLGSLFGADLCRSMACALTGEAYASASNTAGLAPIALFPAEWMREPNSPHLLQSYHDVPWYERRIVAAAFGRALQKSPHPTH